MVGLIQDVELTLSQSQTTPPTETIASDASTTMDPPLTTMVPSVTTKELPSTESISVHSILQCQHIIDAIVAFTPRKTQVVCLRVDRRFHEAAGRAIYHTITLDEDNMIPFFSGLLIGTDIQDNLDNCCRHGTKDNNTGCDKKAASVPSPANSGKKKKANKRKGKANANKQNKKMKGNKSIGTSMVVSRPAPKVNFKAELLKHVRVVTVGSHHSCLCDLYGPEAAEMMYNIDTLRVVPDFQMMFVLDKACDNENEPCAFFSNLQPRKVVLRNLDAGGLPVPEYTGSKWHVPSVEEVVYFLPINGRCYENDDYGFGLFCLGDLFEHAKNFKIVFYPKWEGWNSSDDLFSFVFQDPGVTLDEIVYPPSQVITYVETNYTICGLEQLNFVPGGDLCRMYKYFFPNRPLTRTILCEAARDELRDGTLQCAMVPLSDSDSNEEDVYDSNYPENAIYKTLSEYLLDTAARRHEVNADD